MQKEKKKTFLSILIIVSAFALFAYSLVKNEVSKDEAGNLQIDIMDKSQKAKQYEIAKEIVKPAGFINTEKINIKDLIGKKVILVDFWTYSCINCLRTTPYLNSWYEKYKDKGLEIVGVHTPEFSFEKEYENVVEAVEKSGIEYPVVLDNDYATWRAYQNRYWPRKYLIDIDGFIVYDHIGEGAYKETEEKIQELLEERMIVLGQDEDIDRAISVPVGAEEVDLARRRSPEIYFGADRNNYLGSGKKGKEGEQSLSQPEGVKTNILYLVGDWDFDSEYAENKSGGAKIIFRYQAQKVFLVASSELGVKVKILIDGEPVGVIAGADLKGSVVEIKEDRLYRIIEDKKHAEHVLEIIIESSGLKAFTFTFG